MPESWPVRNIFQINGIGKSKLIKRLIARSLEVTADSIYV